MKSDPYNDSEVRNWAMFLHLSVLAGYFLVPIAGLIAPIVIWQVQKDKMPELDVHGKIVVNAMISYFIYSLISGLLSLVLIGIPFLIAVAIMMVACPIIGGLKASNGEIWHYPLTISFIN